MEDELNLNLPVNIRAIDLVDALETQEQAFELIKHIESQMAEYEFLEKVFYYFLDEMIKQNKPDEHALKNEDPFEHTKLLLMEQLKEGMDQGYFIEEVS